MSAEATRLPRFPTGQRWARYWAVPRWKQLRPAIRQGAHALRRMIAGTVASPTEDGTYWQALRAKMDESVRNLGCGAHPVRAVAGRYTLRVSPERLEQLDPEKLADLTARARKHAADRKLDFLGRPLIIRRLAADDVPEEAVRVEWTYDPPRPFACFLVLDGPEQGREWVVEGTPFRIGRDRQESELLIATEHSSVSRTHGEVVATDEGYAWLDGSRNGTWSATERLPASKPWPLAVGTQLRLGDAATGVSLKFELRDSRGKRTGKEASA